MAEENAWEDDRSVKEPQDDGYYDNYEDAYENSGFWRDEDGFIREAFEWFGQSWNDWNIVPGKEDSGAGKDGFTPGYAAKDPFRYYDWENGETRLAFQNLRKWGEAPVRAAAKEIGIKGVDNLDQLKEIDAWLVENYGDLFPDPDAEEEDEKEPYVPTVYEPTELEIADYVPTETLKINKSDVTIGSSPQYHHPMKIGGIKPTTETSYFSQQRVTNNNGVHVGTVHHKDGNPYNGSWASPDGSWSHGENLLNKNKHLNSYDDLLGAKDHKYGPLEHVRQEQQSYKPMQINP